MVHNYQENCILECSSSTDTRSDFLLIFLQRMSGYGVDLYGDGDVERAPGATLGKSRDQIRLTECSPSFGRPDSRPMHAVYEERTDLPVISCTNMRYWVVRKISATFIILTT